MSEQDYDITCLESFVGVLSGLGLLQQALEVGHTRL